MYVCKTIEHYSNMCLKKETKTKPKNQKHKPVGNSESEGSCLTTVYPCGLLCDGGGGGGRWHSGWCLGTTEVGWRGTGRLAPPLPCPQPKGVKERRPESGRWLYCTRTPLGDQESMLTEETQTQEKRKRRKVQNTSCTLVVLTRRDSTRPRLLAGQTPLPVPPLPET